MNKGLSESIILHIYANLGIVDTDFVDQNSLKSILSKDFLLDKKITFESDSGDIQNKVWGCNLSVSNQQVTILVADCSVEEQFPEYSLLIDIEGAPMYATYLVISDVVDSEPLIAFSANKEWMYCNTYLQATFLAGMEQIREIGFSWKKAENIDHQFDMIKAFIKYHSSYYEANNEG